MHEEIDNKVFYGLCGRSLKFKQIVLNEERRIASQKSDCPLLKNDQTLLIVVAKNGHSQINHKSTRLFYGHTLARRDEVQSSLTIREMGLHHYDSPKQKKNERLSSPFAFLFFVDWSDPQ